MARDASFLNDFSELSPLPERVVVGVFMASVALEAVAQHMPENVAAALTLGAGVLKITGFAVGAIILTSAA